MSTKTICDACLRVIDTPEGAKVAMDLVEKLVESGGANEANMETHHEWDLCPQHAREFILWLLAKQGAAE